MLWYIPLFLYIASLVTQLLWQRNYAKDSILPDTFPPALSYVMVLMPVSLIAGLLMSHHISWSAWLVLLLLVEGSFIGVFNWLMFAALRHMPVAKFEMVFQLYAVVVVVFGWLLLGESLTALQAVGGALLLAAAYVAIQAPESNIQELRKHTSARAILFAIGAAVTLGIGLVTEKAALQYMDIGAYFIFGFGMQAIAIGLLAAKDISKKTLRAITPNDIKQSAVMGTISVCVGFSYIVAIKMADNISLVTIFSSSSLPLTVLAGYFILRERDNVLKLCVATLLGLVGLVLVAL